ncbi:hypothetical protein [Sorangium sp. So ce1000]|uniref:hypothetical protein n=1 Tax=Sorangium sp. So ce1000 TaxID=3133325 RepID=UPI003F640EC2
MSQQLDLFVPDRFDMLQRRAVSQLDSIVVPVDDALQRVKFIHRDMKAAGRGYFLIFQGDSGSGKSTFLSTVNLFLEGVQTFSIPRGQTVEAALRRTPSTEAPLRVIIIEGRDALREVSASEIEAAIHEINAFIRSERGERTLVVWPSNTDDLTETLISTCQRVGDDSLLGIDAPAYRFTGPPKEQFTDIAARTVATLNQGASLANLGVSIDRAKELTSQATTIGRFMGLLRSEILRNQNAVDALVEKERFSLWIVVASGNDPEGDVAALTRGALWDADIESLISATEANVVKDLKKSPEKIGILGAVLRAKILHLPSVTALAIANDFADDRLKQEMAKRGLVVPWKDEALTRLDDSDLGRALSGMPRGTRPRGPKVNTEDTFKKLSEIASKNDVLLNESVGRSLQAKGYVSHFGTEMDLGTGLTRRTDLVCQATVGRIRLELMWRARTGRADIANYALTKLYNYGRAIGFLE